MYIKVQQIAKVAAIIACIIIRFQVVASENILPKRVSDWENVTGFDINSEGNYMVVSLRKNGVELLYESHFDGALWSIPVAIESINKFASEGENIGGPSLYFDAKTLFFHANISGGEGGYDIYYSNRQADGWSEPQKMGNGINSQNNEYYPSVPPGAQKLFFSRSNENQGFKKPSRSPDCQTFFVSTKSSDGIWQTPKPMHDAINKGCQFGPNFTKDGKTVYFSSVDQENPKEGYNIYFAREILPGSWLLPMKISQIASESTIINPRLVGKDIYYLVQTESRRETTGVIYKAPIPEQFMPLNTIVTSGNIIQLENQTPLKTSLRVLDPITLNVLGEFESDNQTGQYNVMLCDDATYMIDVRDKGYSFANYHLDYRGGQKKLGPELVELFNEIELDLSVYDSEIFRPLEADVWVEVLSDKKRRINGIKKESGSFLLKLPIGHNYKVCASAKGFEEKNFEFKLWGDITFSQFERDLPLVPRKKAFEILISDTETKEIVNADITFKNLNREEVITFNTATMSETVAKVEEKDKKSLADPNLAVPYKNDTSPFRFALVIGNEDYSSFQVGLQKESNVDFAIRDANLFKDYAIRVLGVPEHNVLFLTNARAIQMHDEIQKLSNIIKVLNGEAEVFFYYAGHGFPDEKTQDPYIIPVDVTGTSLRYGVKLTDLYTSLTEHPSKRVTVFLDACFSGGARNVGLVSARAVKVRPKPGMLKGNLVVFSASSENQTAHPYRDVQHGMFTYIALHKLRETQGDISYKEYSDYLRETVGVRSIIINNAEQTPQTNVSPAAEETWHKWNFKLN
ncbi:MAG: caspase family protein [Bacteroidales bacterium]